MRKTLAFAALALAAHSASANIRISEWMYQGTDGEYFEIVNLGPISVDLSGWSFDDADRVPGAMSLSDLGILAPNQAAVVTEATAAAFRTAWGLTTAHKVLGENVNNLGRSDEINIYDNTGTLVDRLTYGDQTFSGTIRTQNKSGWNTPAGTTPWGNVTTAWKFSVVGDSQQSKASVGGDIGSPCVFVPTPGTVMLAGFGLLAASKKRR